MPGGEAPTKGTRRGGSQHQQAAQWPHRHGLPGLVAQLHPFWPSSTHVNEEIA
jgi:hypothetical protein